ncbi:MAG TPA: DUF4252 domain-containing protein [Draconibacterium sp.]|nr:DUF4252 domain-containing protein [Draconibacterium sp.]
MKTIRIFIAAVFVLAAQFSNAQSKSYKMYDAFSNMDGVTNFSFTKNMTDAFNIDLGDKGDEKNVTGDLHEIRFMSYNPKKGNLSGSEFTKKAVALLSSKYKKYVDENNEDDDAKIYLLGGKKKFKECHVFITNENDNQMRFVVSFYGDFNVKDLDGLKKTGQEFSDEE